MSLFLQRLHQRWLSANSLICVGLDPDPLRLPVCLQQQPKGLELFLRHMVDATAPYVCAFKPQYAHFAAVQALESLQYIINYIQTHYADIPVILDAKRGDIGSTASLYAREAFEVYGADAVTVNPYMGEDTIRPFTDYHDKGVIVLCRTSNAGAAVVQHQCLANGEPLYRYIAQLCAQRWNSHGNLGLVVGATAPQELAQVRQCVGDMPILVPGVGAQGGDIAQVVQAGQTSQGLGLMINASRAVLFASQGEQYAQAGAAVVQHLQQAANHQRPACGIDSAVQP